jgi:hypothetical protein
VPGGITHEDGSIAGVARKHGARPQAHPRADATGDRRNGESGVARLHAQSRSVLLIARRRPSWHPRRRPESAPTRLIPRREFATAAGDHACAQHAHTYRELSCARREAVAAVSETQLRGSTDVARGRRPPVARKRCSRHADADDACTRGSSSGSYSRAPTARAGGPATRRDLLRGPGWSATAWGSEAGSEGRSGTGRVHGNPM